MMYRITQLIGLLAGLLLLTACQSLSNGGAELTAAQIAALKQEGFIQSDEGWEFSANEKLLFGTNEATLLPSARQTVDRITRLLVSMDIVNVRVDGHTDATGSVTYNEQLSRRRAQVVADEMLASGMPASGVRVRGVGSRLPVASNQSVEGRAQNRRVVLIVGTG